MASALAITLNAWIIPVTVPRSPNRGLVVAIPFSNRRYFRRLAPTRSPESIMACSTSTLGRSHFLTHAAKTSAIGLRFSSHSSSASRGSSVPAWTCSRNFRTKGRGMTRPLRKLMARSKIKRKRTNELMASGIIIGPPCRISFRARAAVCELVDWGPAGAEMVGVSVTWPLCGPELSSMPNVPSVIRGTRQNATTQILKVRNIASEVISTKSPRQGHFGKCVCDIY